MTDHQRSISDELREIELAKAKIELQLKEHELRYRPRWWTQVLGSSAFLAAVATACITGAITLNSQWQAELDKKREELRYEHETNKSILLGIVNPGDSYSIASKLKLFLDHKNSQ
jgi:hypothetical protein